MALGYDKPQTEATSLGLTDPWALWPALLSWAPTGATYRLSEHPKQYFQIWAIFWDNYGNGRTFSCWLKHNTRKLSGKKGLHWKKDNVSVYVAYIDQVTFWYSKFNILKLNWVNNFTLISRIQIYFRQWYDIQITSNVHLLFKWTPSPFCQVSHINSFFL